MSKGQNLKVGFVSSRRAYVEEGKVYMDTANALLIEGLKDSFLDFSLAIIGVTEKHKSFDYSFNVKTIYQLPEPFSYKGGILNFRKIMVLLKRLEKSCDILIIQLPFIGIGVLPFLKKPTVYHVCANVLTAASNPVKYKGIKRFFSITYATGMHFIYKILFSRAVNKVIVNGNELKELYSEYNPIPVLSSSIIKDHIVNYEFKEFDTVKIVFLGRPSLEKGFDLLIKALTQLEYNFEFSAIGFTKQEFIDMFPELYEESASILHRMHFHGIVTWQNGLRDILKDQMIGVIPSRSEGTPRVILELMSQGVAVIGSDVGGIPSIIHNGINGLIFENGKVDDLLYKLNRLIIDNSFRNKMVKHGLETAKNNTINDFVSTFIVEINNIHEQP